MVIGNFNDIRARNISTKYPDTIMPSGWVDPGHIVRKHPEDQTVHERYRFPKGDFLKDGFAPPCLSMTDHTIYKHQDKYHMFATAGTPGAPCVWEGQHSYIFHATTVNFIEWEIHGVALYNNPDNYYEAAHCWPPFVFRHAEKFIMIYCGIDFADDQYLCMATSKDLFKWERYPGNPIIDPGKLNWTQKRSNGKSHHCRDPHVEKIDDTYYLYYTALCDDGYSAVGLAASEDLAVWHDLGPCFKRGASKDNYLTESPLLIVRKGKYYLLPSQSPGVTCFASDDPTDFHHAPQIPVDGHLIWAPELIDDSIENSYLISFYLIKENDNRRLFLGRMDWLEDRIKISVISKKEELDPWIG